MKNLLKLFKNLKLKNILTMLIASSLVFISTACSQGTVAQVEKKAADTVQKVASDDYDQYDANQSFKGGINGYNDDRRYDAGTAAKSKALVDTAKSRKAADSFGEIVDNVKESSVLDGDAIENTTKSFSRKLERNKDNVLDYVDDKSDNLKRNLKKVPDSAQDIFEDAVDTAQDAVEDATKAAKSNAKNIKGNFEDLS